jgi:regulatory protein
MLAAKPRSEQGLREILMSLPGAELDDVDECMANLKDKGLINDRLLAQNYAAYRTSTKPVGRSRLARELVAKRVPQEIVEEALGSLYDGPSQEELIERAIAKRMRTHGHAGGPNADRRMFDHLSRLGFDYDLIVRKVRQLRDKTDSGDRSE